MLIVFRFVLLFFLFLGLHAFNNLFFLQIITQCFHQIDLFHLFIGCLFHGIFHPAVGFSSYIDKHVTGWHPKDIGCRWLETMKIHSAIHQHGQFDSCRILSKELPYPVINWKDRSNDLQIITAVGTVIFRFAAACGQASYYHHADTDNCN